jgi:hypothetical protein
VTACCGILIHIDEQPDAPRAEGAKTSDRRAEALRIYMSGLNLEQVETKLDISVRTLRRLLAGTPMRPPGPGRRSDVSDGRVLELREVHRNEMGTDRRHRRAHHTRSQVSLRLPPSPVEVTPSKQHRRQQLTRWPSVFDGGTSLNSDWSTLCGKPSLSTCHSALSRKR